MSWVAVLFIVLIVQLVARKMSLVPAGLQNGVEWIVESVLDMMENTLHSHKKAVKYLPIVATFFIMIVVSNWFGILPGVGSIGFYETIHSVPASAEATAGKEVLVPFLRSPASDLNFTLALAVLSILIINVAGVAAIGLKHHVSKFINFSNPIKFFVGILELIGEVAKMVSLSFRLFGNVFAGEVLLIIVGFLAPFIAPIPFLMLEIFVGAIQALVFATLTLVFLSIAVEEHT